MSNWHPCPDPVACAALRKQMSATAGSAPLSLRNGLENKYVAMHSKKGIR